MNIEMSEENNVEQGLITRASFAELDRYVGQDKYKGYLDQIWPFIDASPITPRSIDGLILDGWVVEREEKKLLRSGKCDRETKTITLFGSTEQFERRPYSRDVTLIHELVHAHYAFLNSHITDGKNAIEDKIGEPMTEWMARQLRATPDILQAAVLGFDLEPYVYDRASYVAFVVMNPPGQKLFPFTYEFIGDIELALDADK
jgi:hypothetical protein